MTPWLSYWPTLLWLLGYIEFGIHTRFPWSQALPAGWSVFFAIAIAAALCFQKSRFNSILPTERLGPHLRSAGVTTKITLLIVMGMFAVAALASRLPPHLAQEYDAINYHMAIVRQHWLSRSFDFIPWAMADLWPMPIQEGFAPTWFAGTFINKWPQFLTTIWGFGLLTALGWRLSAERWEGFLPALAVYSTHGVMIQMGTAMMDLSNLYFLLAFLHALFLRRHIWAGLHGGVFLVAKSFHPLLVATFLLIALPLFWVLNRDFFIELLERLRIALPLSLGIGVFLMMRSAMVSLDRAGTPLYPFAVCSVSSAEGCQGFHGDLIRKNARDLAEIRNAYGSGRSPLDFATHVWRIAVPKKGVNNDYDYPLGLGWLILVVLGIYSGLIASRDRPISPYLLSAGVLWILWWFGSQQSRWLYPVLALGWLGTIEAQKRVRPGLLAGLLCLSAGFSAVSMVRGLGPTLFKSRQVVQQTQESKIRRDTQGRILSRETLYANDPITIHGAPDGQWILPQSLPPRR